MTTWLRSALWPMAALLGWLVAGALGVAAAIQRIELQEGHVHVDWDHVHMEWGNAAEWSAGVFGGVAAVAAFGALFYAAREWSAAQSERREKEADQARLICVEPARQGPEGPKIWDFTAADDILVRNHSDAPVFDLEIDSLDREAVDRLVWENLGSGQPQTPAKRAVFRPGEMTGLLTVVGDTGGAREASNPRLNYLVFTFTDANGRRWRRTGTGQPVRVFSSIAAALDTG